MANEIAVRYPEVTVKLIGQDGNAFMVLGLVQEALQKAGVPSEERALFREEAIGGDYNHLLATVTNWVTVE